MEMQLSASKREAAAMRAALNAARTQRDDLEAELMEAALDVMDNEKQRATLHVRHPTIRGLPRTLLTQRPPATPQLLYWACRHASCPSESAEACCLAVGVEDSCRRLETQCVAGVAGDHEAREADDAAGGVGDD